jgi:Fur family zinc uptake transcriptional regulator
MTRVRHHNDEAVLGVLQAAGAPLTAYQVLAALRDHGVQSPPVVYRALDRLEKAGAIHRVEQLNAYVACHGHPHDDQVVLAICTACRKVEEWPAIAVLQQLDDEARHRGFRPAQKVFELRGLCAACHDQDAGEAIQHGVHGGHDGACDHGHDA